MEQILDASGYHFHVLTIEGHKWWIGKEIAHAFDYSKVNNMLRSIDKDDLHTLVLNNSNGLRELKGILYQAVGLLNKHTGSCWTEVNVTKTPHALLVREDTLQEFLTIHTRKPDAKEIGKKLYKYFTKPVEKKVEKKENSLQKLLRSEVEALELGSRFRKWYMGYVDCITFLFLLTIKSTSIQFAEGKDSSSYINNSCLI